MKANMLNRFEAGRLTSMNQRYKQQANPFKQPVYFFIDRWNPFNVATGFEKVTFMADK